MQRGQPARGYCRCKAQSAATAQGHFALFPECSARAIRQSVRPCRSRTAALPIASQAISSLLLGSFPSSHFNWRPKIAGLGKPVCSKSLAKCKLQMLVWEYAEEERRRYRKTIGLSAQRSEEHTSE